MAVQREDTEHGLGTGEARRKLSPLAPKAIETWYGGHRFRSRLEARWAVFLDELALGYVYEPEGYELPSGPYLPDFFVPAWEAWVEVKPGDLGHRVEELLAAECRVAELARQTGQRSVLLIGLPWPHRHGTISREPEEEEGRARFGSLACCRRCGDVGLHSWDSAWASKRFVGLSRRPAHSPCPHDREPLDGRLGAEGQTANHLANAFAVANGARFEFGERGRW